jgi:hypothetical protein
MALTTPIPTYDNPFAVLLDAQIGTERLLEGVDPVIINAIGITKKGLIIVKFRTESLDLRTESQKQFNNQIESA